MKRLQLIPVFILLFFFTSAQNREKTLVTPVKISDNLYQLKGGSGANGGMYIGDNEVLIIDSKMDKNSVDGIFTVAKSISNKPVTLLVNTHSDGDHVNGNVFFPKDVSIIAHENCRREFLLPQRDGSPSNWLVKEKLPFVPEITFNDKMQIHLGSKTIELYYFGVGHTTGDIVVYFPEEKTAFIGDQVFFERPQLIHSYKGGNSFEHVKTTQKMLATLEADTFCSGHSEIAAFQKKVKNLIKEGKTLEETQSSFEENEKRLVESVYNEIRAME
jgi:glyoxylase-like metal-dependent hydrolase (beta-lactamase superfamily II)